MGSRYLRIGGEYNAVRYVLACEFLRDVTSGRRVTICDPLLSPRGEPARIAGRARSLARS
jgi:hypothetical protein